MNVNFGAWAGGAMSDDSGTVRAAQILTFDWYPPKREWNLQNRQIDFQDARFVLDGPKSFADLTGKAKYAIRCLVCSRM